MTPLLAALSSLTYAARRASVALSVSPESAASRKLRTADFSDDLTALLRCLAFSFCLLRLICGLLFATRVPRYVSCSVVSGVPGANHRRGRALGDAEVRACGQPTMKDIRDRHGP